MLPTPALPITARIDRYEAAARDDARAQARATLPAPGQAAARVALAVCEVEAGMRPYGQLERLCHRSLHASLAGRVRRGGGPAVTATSLRRVVTQEHTPGLAEAVVLVRRGPRLAAIALRLDAAPGHWQVVELQY